MLFAVLIAVLIALIFSVKSDALGPSSLSDLATKVFELSQTLRQLWLTADYAAKRRMLEIVF